MDVKLSHAMKYKVNQSYPAVFADNLAKVVMSGYGIPWKTNYTTVDCYEKFYKNFGADILFDVEVLIQPEYELAELNPSNWHMDDAYMSKILNDYKKEFYENIEETNEDSFILQCSLLLYFSAMYFKKGMKNAPVMAFLEVYSFACLYLKQIGFTPELKHALSY